MAEPPVAPKEYLIKSSKFMWRALLISNFALGGYIFLKARNREIGNANKKKAKETSARNKKAVVEELPSTLPGNPTDAPSTSTTTSQTWDS